MPTFLSHFSVHVLTILLFYQPSMGPRKLLNSSQIAVICALAKENKTNKEIAAHTALPLRTVQRWTLKFRSGGGVKDPPPHKPAGPKPKLSQRTLNVIRRQLEVEPRITSKELKSRNPRLLAGVAERTLRDYLKKVLGYRSCRSVPKPWVTRAHRVNRLRFVAEHREWTLDKWRTVLWSDEASFEVTDNQRGRVYRRPGSDPTDPRYTKHTVKHPDSLMVWGCFSYHGVGKLVFLPKNIRMNQINYFELVLDELDECMVQCKADIFMQDGAPCHRAKLISNWFDFCGVELLAPWPGNSPDLNPIENLWAIIKRRLQDKDTSSMDRLQSAIQDIWDNLDKEHLQHLADSLPTRLEKVKKKKGYPINN